MWQRCKKYCGSEINDFNCWRPLEQCLNLGKGLELSKCMFSMFLMHTHAFEYVQVHKSNYIHVQGLEVTILSASANLGICSYVLPNFGIYLGKYSRGINNFEDTWGYFPMSFTTMGFTWVLWGLHGGMFLCYSQLWGLLGGNSHGIHKVGSYMGKCSHVIYNFGIYLSNIPMAFTTLGITLGNFSILFTTLGETLQNIPILFPTFGLNCGRSHNIFSMLGYQERQSLFPQKNLFMRSWGLTTSQKYPKKGISCSKYFPIMGKFLI